MLKRRSLLTAATGSILACYGVIDRANAAATVKITPPVVDKLTIQAVVDTNHDRFISGAQVPGVAIERVRSPASFNGRTLESQWGLSLHLISTKGQETHLAPAPQPYLDSIMAELMKYDIDHLIPMHCSGSNFLETAKRQMPEKLVLCTTGSKFTFTA